MTGGRPTPLPRRGVAAAAMAALWLCAAAAAARAESVTGVVLDRFNAREIPVDQVQVRLCSDPARTRCGTTLTQRNGRFYLEVPPGNYVFVGTLLNGRVFTTRVRVAAGRQSYFKIYLPR